MHSPEYILFFISFSYYYEDKWIENIKQRDLGKARIFGNFSQSIVDLCKLNNKQEIIIRLSWSYKEKMLISLFHSFWAFLSKSIMSNVQLKYMTRRCFHFSY